jgi:hypothetical protein
MRLQLQLFTNHTNKYFFCCHSPTDNCNDYRSVLGVWLQKKLCVSSISNQSFADASSSNITKLPEPMPMAYQEQK